MSKRINVVLPETTLRAQLERATIRDRDIDREVAVDWIAVDQQTWQRLDRNAAD